MSLQPFFSYFGSKHRLARRYPFPRHATIVEPFAGSAGYACAHWSREVVLIEKSPRLAACWRYLLGASEREILALPDVVEGQSIEALSLCQEARDLIVWNVHRAVGGPRSGSTPWGNDRWGRDRRARIASQLAKVRHWRLIEGDFTEAPDVEATWFVDPPYEVAGNFQYVTGCKAADLDFAELGAWCRARRGQVMVCENEGASWLPFRSFAEIAGGHKRSTEAIWTNDFEPERESA